MANILMTPKGFFGFVIGITVIVIIIINVVEPV